MPQEKRRVSGRGQVTIPKRFRDQVGIREGDELIFEERGGGIIMYPPVDDDRLAEGYQKREERSRELAAEMEATSTEASEQLGDTPEW